MTGRNLAVSVIIIWALIMAVCSCATLSLPDGATQQEKRDAACMDAQAAYGLAESSLRVVVDPAAKLYWYAFLAGARKGIQTYCLDGPAK